jgi:hypothetical protein
MLLGLHVSFADIMTLYLPVLRLVSCAARCAVLYSGSGPSIRPALTPC